VLIIARCSIISQASWIQSSSSHSTRLRVILILSSHPRQGIRNIQVFRLNFTCISHLCHASSSASLKSNCPRVHHPFISPQHFPHWQNITELSSVRLLTFLLKGLRGPQWYRWNSRNCEESGLQPTYYLLGSGLKRPEHEDGRSPPSNNPEIPQRRSENHDNAVRYGRCAVFDLWTSLIWWMIRNSNLDTEINALNITCCLTQEHFISSKDSGFWRRAHSMADANILEKRSVSVLRGLKGWTYQSTRRTNPKDHHAHHRENLKPDTTKTVLYRVKEEDWGDQFGRTSTTLWLF
jgi:hypothetical protein